MKSKKVVIIGSSYSSAAVFYYLEKYLSKSRQEFDILFLSNKPYYFFSELLQQNICNDFDINDVCQELRSTVFLRAGVSYIESNIINVDFNSNIIKTLKGELNYDLLVLAVENDINDEVLFDENECLYLNNFDDVLKIKSVIRKNLEACALEKSLDKKKALLTFSIIGGNVRGVEIACSISDYVNQLLKNKYSEINKSLLKVNLFEQRNFIGKENNSFFNSYLFYALNKKGITIFPSSKITKINSGKLIINNEKEINSQVVIHSSKNKVSSLIRKLSLESDNGHNIFVDFFLKVQGLNNVFAIGKTSKCIDLSENTKKSIIFLNQEAKICAYNLVAKINGNPLKPLKEVVEFENAYLGFRMSLLKIKNYCLCGFIAWLLNRLVYCCYFIGLKKKLTLLVGLMVGLFGLKENILYDVFDHEYKKEKKDILIKV